VDKIIITDLQTTAILGVYAHERIRPQPVLINLTLFTDTRTAGRSDDLADAINYAAVCDRVLALVEGTQAFLIERLAADIAALILDEFEVTRVVVRVDKPAALAAAASAGVEIDRQRGKTV
jgi:FolB domain-containing protein